MSEPIQQAAAEVDELTIPADNEHAQRLAKLAAIAADGRIKQAREAIGLAYAMGRNVGRLEGSEKAAAAWGASIEKHFPKEPGDASAPPGT